MTRSYNSRKGKYSNSRALKLHEDKGKLKQKQKDLKFEGEIYANIPHKKTRSTGRYVRHVYCDPCLIFGKYYELHRREVWTWEEYYWLKNRKGDKFEPSFSYTNWKWLQGKPNRKGFIRRKLWNGEYYNFL